MSTAVARSASGLAPRILRDRTAAIEWAALARSRCVARKRFGLIWPHPYKAEVLAPAGRGARRQSHRSGPELHTVGVPAGVDDRSGDRAALVAVPVWNVGS